MDRLASGADRAAYYRDLLGLPSRARDPFRIVFRVDFCRVVAVGIGLIEVDGAGDNDNRQPKHPRHLRPC